MPKIKQPQKKTGRARKEEAVSEISTRLEESDSLVLTDYQGLTHKQLEDLKRNLKKSNSTFAITKNTLLKISIEKTKKYADLLKEHTYEAPTAALFIKGDVIEALKLIAKANKDFGLPKIKIGVIDGQTVDESQVLKMASLPNRETLLAQLAGMLNSPISGFVFVLNANLQKFVLVLNAISKNKPAEEAATPSAEPAVSVSLEESAMPTSEEKPAEESSEAQANKSTEPVNPVEDPIQNEEPTDESKGGES